MSEQQEKQLALILQRYAVAVEIMPKSDPRLIKIRLSIFELINSWVRA